MLLIGHGGGFLLPSGLGLLLRLLSLLSLLLRIQLLTKTNNMKLGNLLVVIIIIVIFLGGGYLIGSAAAWSFDISMWCGFGRFLFSLYSLLILLIIGIKADEKFK